MNKTSARTRFYESLISLETLFMEFEQAERYIEGANGIPAPERRTFQNRKTRDVRVDIEVLAGRAFIAVALLVVLYFILN